MIEDGLRSYLFWVKILQVVQWEDRLKSFPKRLELPGDPFVQSPVHHQLRGQRVEVKSSRSALWKSNWVKDEPLP